jgi:3-oxoacyl-[acyl-carrier-protein] synthase III
LTAGCGREIGFFSVARAPGLRWARHCTGLATFLNARPPEARTRSDLQRHRHPKPRAAYELRLPGPPGQRGGRAPNAIEMACDAAADCLSRSRYTAAEIELLIYCGIYRNDFLAEPALAAIVAGKLGMGSETRTVLAFDLINGATGFLNACHIGAESVRSEKCRSVMIVAAEIENNVHADNIPGLAQMASAIVLDGEDSEEGFESFHFDVFPEYTDAVVTHMTVRGGRGALHIDRRPDWRDTYQRCVQMAIRNLLDTGAVNRSRCRLVLAPHLSSSLRTHLAGILDLPLERIGDGGIAHSGISGDLLTSFVPCAVQAAAQSGAVASGDTALIVTAGSGGQIGCATYQF